MSRTQALRQPERVAAWPRISATVRRDGTGTLTVNGTERPCAAPSVEELRTGLIARCAALARRLRRPVRLTVSDGAATWSLAVHAEGVVQLVDDAGTIPPADGLAPHEGRCRVCRRLQPVTAAQCTQCGVDEPHRVEADPIDARAVVPDATAIDTLEHTIAAEPQTSARPRPGLHLTFSTQPPIEATENVALGRNPEPIDTLEHTIAAEPPASPRPRPVLHLTFSTQPPIETTENVALGRNPEPIGGRRPIQVASPDRMLSRTHVLIDVDDAGRIVVTDHHSGNGTEAQTQPPMRLAPGTPYVIHEGTTLLMGDVAVLVKFA